MKNEYANTATEIESIKDTGLRAKPVLIDGVMQEALRELLTPHDCIVSGNKVRIYAGTIVSLTSGGIGSTGQQAMHGKLMRDLTLKCLDGVSRILPAGSQIEIIA